MAIEVYRLQVLPVFAGRTCSASSCAEGDYWRSVIKAVDLAANAKDCQGEIAWFLEPIPNGKPMSISPIVIAAETEAA